MGIEIRPSNAYNSSVANPVIRLNCYRQSHFIIVILCHAYGILQNATHTIYINKQILLNPFDMLGDDLVSSRSCLVCSRSCLRMTYITLQEEHVKDPPVLCVKLLRPMKMLLV